MRGNDDGLPDPPPSAVVTSERSYSYVREPKATKNNVI